MRQTARLGTQLCEGLSDWEGHLLDVLVTGSLGFIGGHTVHRLISGGHKVISIDNHSRLGTELNLEFLQGLGGDFRHFKLDIEDASGLDAIINEEQPTHVIHLAAQVAVTTSVLDPGLDLRSNLLGTFNILESMRRHAGESHLVFASTNKVYGAMERKVFLQNSTRYFPEDDNFSFSEYTPLDFSTPYGCSKGAADQYVLDWAKTFGLSSTVFRQSCVYGERQLGVEDQGWLAWFAIAHLLDRNISVYGSGKQVRDLLHVTDLVDAYMLALEQPKNLQGAFNIGGGQANSLSVLEALTILGAELGSEIKFSFSGERPGDQKYFVSDNSWLESKGWALRVDYQPGIAAMANWLKENMASIKRLHK